MTRTIGPDSYFSKNSTETSYYADEVAPIPPRNTWGEMSAPQLLDIKSRLMGYQRSIPRDATMQQQSLAAGVAYIDAIIASAGQR